MLETPSATSNTAMTCETDRAIVQLTVGSGSGEPVVIGSSVPASANDSTRFFDFFGLPRELRDKIYEQPALFEHQNLHTHDGERFHTNAKRLDTSLLLVSRQFHYEYSDRCADQQMLCLRDYPDFLTTSPVITVPDKARCWTLDYCNISGPVGLGFDLSILTRFLRRYLPSYLALRTVRIKLFVMKNFSSVCSISKTLRTNLARLVAIQKVDSVDVYEFYDKRHIWHHKRAEEPRALIARWKRGGNTQIEYLDPGIKSDGTVSEWEAFMEKEFNDDTSFYESEDEEDDSSTSDQSDEDYDDVARDEQDNRTADGNQEGMDNGDEGYGGA